MIRQTLAIMAFLAAGPGAAQDMAMDLTKTDLATLKAGTYTLDPAHSSLIFEVNHIGISTFRASFDSFTVTLELDPANPATAQLTASIDVTSLDIPTPEPEGFRAMLMAPPWFDAENHPQITLQSSAITLGEARNAQLAGTLTINGKSAPITMTVTALGGWEGNQYDPNARIGFHAEGSFSRSAVGFDVGLPPPGTTMGVSDEVIFSIDTEFTGPPWEG
ncbi:YceI family protein [Oceanicola sp. 502str15]|uniref:YceI family protein n=1 Tax=Oceanicola sp. 502str15 TaxID=2696061 RepID=UPI0020951A41|nr:YceI family protein [Oceanicola sp. 502str15]MCO6381821.1 polyisoprenoid-binding protein [Oceanicola sp. 502str15]